MNKEELAEEHSFIKSTIFKAKTIVLIGIRMVKNVLSPVKKYQDTGFLKSEPIIAFSESELWNSFDNKDNWILTAGKIENLRIASKKLNGLEVKANETFSFWKHIGNPNIGQGYVVGREIREGCVVPTIAGGLCQISNALYDTALKANFTIVERHKHTKVIKGSLAEQDRDATVKWNYVDLRFKSNYDFRIEVKLTSDKLIVSFKSKYKNNNTTNSEFVTKPSSIINDCYSCGNFGCFKHPDRSSVKQEIATTAFILDEKWIEFDTYIQSIITASDTYIVPLKKNKLIKTNRYSWSGINSVKTKATTLQGMYRAIKLRYTSKNKNNVFELSLILDAKIAKAMAKLIPIDATHLVISQNLLPFIYETGVLGGRTFDVLMTRLPMQNIHKKLDFAYSKHPKSSTLNDFRADKRLIKLENEALAKAQKIITPHTEIAKIFNNKAEKLQWYIKEEKQKQNQSKAGKVLFPASAIGRKGAFEVRKLAKELKLSLVILEGKNEEENFWEDINIEKFNGNFNAIKLVIYPTYIEHQPRLILKAIAKGVPVITTIASGLESFENIKIISDYKELKEAVLKFKNLHSL